MQEIWKSVKGYEGLYEVSNYGNVKSLARIVYRQKNGKRIAQYVEERILKPGDRGGYKGIVLCKDNKRENKLVHRLVAETFIENPLSKKEVNHIDEDKHNNRADNLEWVTHIENSRHGTRGQRIAKANTGNPLTSRQIFQYTEDGELVGTYASPRVAEMETGILRTSITSALYHSTHRLKGYIWKFE